MPDALERRLARMAAWIPDPPAEVTQRARRAVMNASAPVAPRARWLNRLRRLGRPVRIAAAVGGVVVVGCVLALLVIATPDESTTPATAALRPDLPSGPVATCQEQLLLIPCVAGTDAVRESTPTLAGAPWLYSRPGRLSRLSDSAPRPSLVFPPGVTYGQALDSLLTWVTLTGGLPAGTTLGPSLPEGVVLLQPADPAQGIAIDLRAPFGYDPASKRVQTPTYTGAPIDAGAPTSRTLWPRGVRVAVATLPACMVISDRASASVACGRDDQPVVHGSHARLAPLPVVALGATEAGLTAAADRTLAPALRSSVLRRGNGDTATARTIDLRDLRGRVVVLAFFASWCAPCASQAPVLEAIARRYPRRDDLVVLGIAVNDNREDTLRFLDRHRSTITTLADPQGSVAASFGLTGVPETVFIDRQGRVARRIAGALVTPQQAFVPGKALTAESP